MKKVLMKRWVVLTCVIIIFIVTPLRIHANTCGIPPEYSLARPDPEGTPTRIAVGLYLIDISEVNDVKQTFVADIHGTMSWHDSRLSEKVLGSSLEHCNMGLNDIWHPHGNIINQQKIFKSFEDTVEIDRDGNVIYRQRSIGEFSSPVDLKDFPFDSQVLSISAASFRYGPDEVSLIVDTGRTGRMEELSITGWDISLGEPRISSIYLAPQDQELSRIDFSLLAKRYADFYLWKVLLPLALIVLMASTVFWIDPNEVGAQISVSTASVLTLIAFQISFGYLLPRVSYFTRADIFIFGSTLLVFFALAEAILTSRLAKSGRQKLSLLIDRVSRLVYLLLFAGLIIYTLFGTYILNQV
jgi:hypothetical protein